jgi:RNA polymerase subunit RPABC4/transcription elongation factor Spt4
MPRRHNRDEFTLKVIRTLQFRAGNHCSNPDCRQLTSGPNSDSEKATCTGEAAHITAAAPGGARYDHSLTPEERSSIQNGIWLCKYCARLIDADWERYPVFLLREWKQEAEQYADIEHKKVQEPAGSLQKEGLICPFCKTVVEFDQKVCLGCYAEVVHGTTQAESQQTVIIGLMLGIAVSYFLLVKCPEWLSALLPWQIPLGFGLGRVALLVGVILIVLTAVVWGQLEELMRRKRPPRFIRSTIT